jgi:mannose-1-phosphate guanylyltransferase
LKALLLAAGFGTRLRPLTDNLPKCLVPIKGQPLLGIWLARLSAAGCGPFLINAHYKAEQVAAFIETSPYRAHVTLAHEPVPLGTAGTLLGHLDFFGDEDGLLIHADNYCLADFKDFIAAHRRRPPGCLMSMMTFRTDHPSSCGIVTLDERKVVVGFEEKPQRPNGNLANGAVYILSAELLAQLAASASAVTDFSTQVLPSLLSRIYAYETSEPLIDIGTPQTYEFANAVANRPLVATRQRPAATGQKRVFGIQLK